MTKYSKDLTARISIAIETAMPTMMTTCDVWQAVAATAMQRNRVNATIIEVDPVAHRRRQNSQPHRLHIDLHRHMRHRRHLVSPPPLLPPVLGRPSRRVHHQPMYTSRRSKRQPVNHLNSHLHRPSCIRQTPEHKTINSHGTQTTTTP